MENKLLKDNTNDVMKDYQNPSWDQTHSSKTLKQPTYHNYPNYLDRQAWDNSKDPDLMPYSAIWLGLQCLPPI